MEITTYLLFILGICGAVDILLYHAISHGIRTHAGSRQELIVHSLRGPTYAALFLMIPNFALHGAYFWMLVGIFVFDAGVSVWDFAIERASRDFFGGLPPGEYILHMIIAMLFGGVVTSVCIGQTVWASLPTSIGYAPAAVPALLRLVLAIMAVIALYSALLDLKAAIQLGHTTEVVSRPLPIVR